MSDSASICQLLYSDLRRLINAKFRPGVFLRLLVEEEASHGIINGPFVGMKYPRAAVGSSYYPKIIGSYEQELHPVIAQIQQTQFNTIIDIGAAEGYYVCGFAKSFPHAKIIAFEGDLKGRYLLNQNIEMNGLATQVAVHGFCDQTALNKVLAGIEKPILIVCDAEGCEYELIDHKISGAIMDCHILVEMHDHYLKGLTKTLQSRFGKSHRITNLHAQTRVRGDFPKLGNTVLANLLPFRYYRFFLDEFRPYGMNWLWMEPNNSLQ